MSSGSMNNDSNLDEAAPPVSEQAATGVAVASRPGEPASRDLTGSEPERNDLAGDAPAVNAPAVDAPAGDAPAGDARGGDALAGDAPGDKDFASPISQASGSQEALEDEPGQGSVARQESEGQETVTEMPAEDERYQGKPVRRRPKPGERRLQILQTLAEMLETPKCDRITTAALAGKLKVSEAALYRHFASKAQMFEGLIEFIESTLFGLINQITTQEEDGVDQLRQILTMLLSFAERNPGMTRVIIGDALVNEDDRLQVRINQLIDRLELSIKQSFRTAIAQGRLPQEADPAARAILLLSYVQGRWLRFAKGGFRRSPMEGLDAQIVLLII